MKILENNLNDTELGKFIRKLRVKSHLTQIQLSKLTRVSVNDLSYIENGCGIHDKEIAKRLSKFFKVSFEFLFKIQEKPKQHPCYDLLIEHGVSQREMAVALSLNASEFNNMLLGKIKMPPNIEKMIPLILEIISRKSEIQKQIPIDLDKLDNEWNEIANKNRGKNAISKQEIVYFQNKTCKVIFNRIFSEKYIKKLTHVKVFTKQNKLGFRFFKSNSDDDPNIFVLVHNKYGTATFGSCILFKRIQSFGMEGKIISNNIHIENDLIVVDIASEPLKITKIGTTPCEVVK